MNNTDWSNQLYRPLSKGKAETVQIRLIPYCGWSSETVRYFEHLQRDRYIPTKLLEVFR